MLLALMHVQCESDGIQDFRLEISIYVRLVFDCDIRQARLELSLLGCRLLC